MDSDSDADFIERKDLSSEREFLKLQSNLQTSGFREGAGAGQDGAFQSGFDVGYADGFKAAYSLGKLNGMVEALKRNAELLSLDQEELQDLSFVNARFGLCQICKDSSRESPCSCKKTQDMAALSARQKEITKEVLTAKWSTCSSLLEKTGLNSMVLDDLN